MLIYMNEKGKKKFIFILIGMSIVMSMGISLLCSLGKQDEKVATATVGAIAFESNKVEKEISENIGADQEITSLRMERNKNRDLQFELLHQLIDNPETTQGVREKAENQSLLVSQERVLELQIETILKAKNFSNAVVMVKDKQITLMIEKNVAEENFILLSELLQRNTSFSPEDIIIIPK